MKKTPFLDSVLILIKAAASDEHIKFIVADASGRCEWDADAVEEAEEYSGAYTPNAHKEKKKKKKRA